MDTPARVPGGAITVSVFRSLHSLASLPVLRDRIPRDCVRLNLCQGGLEDNAFRIQLEGESCLKGLSANFGKGNRKIKWKTNTFDTRIGVCGSQAT